MGDSDEQFILRENRELAMLPITFDALSPEGQPVGKREVDGFVEVQLSKDQSMLDDGGSPTHAVIEPGTICLWECNDKFVSSLVAPVHTEASAESLVGFRKVTSWKSRSCCASNRPGASRLIAASNFSVSVPGVPYQVLVTRKCSSEQRGRWSCSWARCEPNP